MEFIILYILNSPAGLVVVTAIMLWGLYVVAGMGMRAYRDNDLATGLSSLLAILMYLCCFGSFIL